MAQPVGDPVHGPGAAGGQARTPVPLQITASGACEREAWQLLTLRLMCACAFTAFDDGEDTLTRLSAALR